MQVCQPFILAASLLSTGLRGEVIFSEDFESGSLGNRWERYREGPEYGGFETRPENVNSGKMSFKINAPVNTGEGRMIRGIYYNESDSWIRTWLLPGHDLVYIRWYVKFSADIDKLDMHWCQFWGTRADNALQVLGGAGRRPDGTDRFIANVEPRSVDGKPFGGKIGFYTYWPDMKQSSDGRYWGNFFYPEESFFIELGRWYCFEFMLKCNEPGRQDGEQALWIDGEEIIRVKNMRWRDVEDLRLSMVMFGNYRGRARKELTYWLDDIVISTEYVGPVDK
jgi:hypothetical protein